MESRRPLLARRVMILLVAFPLLGTGTCVQMTQNALIDGFFNTVTPLMIERFGQRLLWPAPGEAAPRSDTG